jgi:TonB family protein
MFITKLALIEWITIFLFSLAVAYAQPQVPPSPTSAAPQRVKVDADTASAMVVQRTPIRYPDAARSARIQGTVVLKVIVNISGDVQEATVISGDPALAQATVDAVKQWKYKPYQAEGSPAEMETQVSISFHLKVPPQVAPPPLGTFRDGSYSNDFFGVNYPLSRDWVRETDLTRSNLASAKDSQGVSVLLAAVHVPQNTDTLTADSSFVVLAENSAAEDCRHYLTSVANTVQSEKDGQQKGDISQFTIASHDFYRADFGFRHGTNNRTFVCTLIKDYMLHWNIVALSKQAVETAISTLSAISFSPPTTPVPP